MGFIASSVCFSGMPPHAHAQLRAIMSPGDLELSAIRTRGLARAGPARSVCRYAFGMCLLCSKVLLGIVEGGWLEPKHGVAAGCWVVATGNSMSLCHSHTHQQGNVTSGKRRCWSRAGVPRNSDVGPVLMGMSGAVQLEALILIYIISRRLLHGSVSLLLQPTSSLFSHESLLLQFTPAPSPPPCLEIVADHRTRGGAQKLSRGESCSRPLCSSAARRGWVNACAGAL